MKFIKLTRAFTEYPIWVSVDKIESIYEADQGTNIVFATERYEPLCVTETVDEVISKCEAQGR